MLADFQKVWFTFAPSERRRAAWMLLLVVLMAVAETVGVLSIMPFLKVLGRPDVIHQNAFLRTLYERGGFHDAHGFIFALGAASITLVVASAIFKAITLHTLNRFVNGLRHSLSSRVLAVYLRQPYEFFLTRNPSILSRNVLSEVDQLMFQLIQPLSQLIAQGTVVLAMTLLIFIYNPLTALAIVAVLGLLYGSIYGLVRKRLASIGHERQIADGGRYQACNEALGGIKDVKVTHSANAYLQQYQRASRILARHQATNETLSQTPLYLVEATGYSLLIVLALMLLTQSHDVAHVLPALGLYGFAAYRMLPAAQIMYRGFAKMKFSSSALQTLHEDLRLPVAADTSGAPLTALAPQHEIRLHGIRYAYPSAPEKAVLADFDLEIPANSSVGIAGKSGAGKSTLMDILLGLLQPQAGTLSVDGAAIDAGNVTAWQRAIGYVPQHIYLADASVAQNIAFGVAPEAIDMQAVERAARAAQIHDFVAGDLPDGYATQVGDRGIRLSGGQRQRVGIARALYHDPAVLFFDEATSALDTQTEEAVNEAIRALNGRKTIVVIAHKESSLRDCASVVTLGDRRAPLAPETDIHSYDAPRRR